MYLFKVNNRNTRKRCEICPKLTIKTPKRRYRRRSGMFIVNFEHIVHLFKSVSVVDFEQLNASWEVVAVRPLFKLFWSSPTNIFTYLKSTIETLEKVWNKFKLHNLTSSWCFYCSLWTYFTHFSSVSIGYFEKVIVSGVLASITQFLKSPMAFKEYTWK